MFVAARTFQVLYGTGDGTVTVTSECPFTYLPPERLRDGVILGNTVTLPNPVTGLTAISAVYHNNCTVLLEYAWVFKNNDAYLVRMRILDQYYEHSVSFLNTSAIGALCHNSIDGSVYSWVIQNADLFYEDEYVSYKTYFDDRYIKYGLYPEDDIIGSKSNIDQLRTSETFLIVHSGEPAHTIYGYINGMLGYSGNYCAHDLLTISLLQCPIMPTWRLQNVILSQGCDGVLRGNEEYCWCDDDKQHVICEYNPDLAVALFHLNALPATRYFAQYDIYLDNIDFVTFRNYTTNDGCYGKYDQSCIDSFAKYIIPALSTYIRLKLGQIAAYSVSIYRYLNGAIRIQITAGVKKCGKFIRLDNVVLGRYIVDPVLYPILSRSLYRSLTNAGLE